LKSMKQWRAEGRKAILLVSAVEFHCFGSFDLMSSSKSQVTLDSDWSIFGCKATELTSSAALQDFTTSRSAIVDMAGSERQSKTGAERPSGNTGWYEAYINFHNGTPEKTPIGVTGALINYELSFLATEILKAADVHRKGFRFAPRGR